MATKYASESEEIDQLITQAQTGDPEACSKIWDRYYPMVRAVCRKTLRKEQDAVEDVVQEVFHKVLSNLNKFQRRSLLGTWICRIAVNACLMHYRTEKRAKNNITIVDIDEAISCATHDLNLIGALPRIQLQRAFRRLSRKNKQTFDLFFNQGYTQKELAEFYGTSEPAIKSRILRARLQLQKHLVGYGTPLTHNTGNRTPRKVTVNQ